MKRLLIIGCVFALLVGCGSTVPLSQAPVVNATPAVVPPVKDDTGPKSSYVPPVDQGTKTVRVTAPAESRLVYFDYDSFVIKPEFQSVIASHATYFKTQPTRKLAIEGHTDERGGHEYNLALGQRRADTVRDALSILGVPQSQMESVSFGKEKPAVVGADEEAYSKNRRVEVRYQ